MRNLLPLYGITVDCGAPCRIRWKFVSSNIANYVENSTPFTKPKRVRYRRQQVKSYLFAYNRVMCNACSMLQLEDNSKKASYGYTNSISTQSRKCPCTKI